MPKPSTFASRLPRPLYEQVTRCESRRFTGPYTAARNEVIIDADWRIRLSATCGPLTRLAARDVKRTLAEAFGIRQNKPGRAIHVTVDPGSHHAREASVISASRDGIAITASTDEGAMRALFDLRWQMLNRQAPILTIGDRELAPVWSTRIFSPVWHRALDQPEDYCNLPAKYLINAARFGFNATYLFADWMDFMSPAAAGKLARRGYQARLNTLRQATAHLGQFGIRLYLHINTLAMPRDHAFFQSTPAMRGAQTWQDGMHCLCSSHPKVLALYCKAAKQLFTDVPDLAGAVLITGGECFLHCYTRPMPQTARGTNCKRCGARAPEDVIAGAVNAFSAGAQAAKSDATVMMWPYSAFTWGDMSAQERLIERIDPSVDVLAGFEKDGDNTIDGITAKVFDYSISYLGPSPRFERLRRTAQQRGLAMHARTESAQCIEMFNVPRIPIMRRWAERFEAIRDRGVDGVHTAWRFYGFCAQRNDEIVYAATWRDRFDIQAVLRTMAGRDFGNAAAKDAVRAWGHFSDGFAAFPYCAGVTGFPYFRGPFYLGPSHPFVFDTTTNNDVPPTFWRVSPAAGEAETDPESSRQRDPRFFIDLTWTQPFGAERVDKALATVDRHWSKGLAALDRASQARGALHDAIADERAIAQVIGCMFKTARHLLAFQVLRQLVTAEPCTKATLRATCRKAIAIVTDEIANATTALQLVRADQRLGYGATYGYAFTADLIEQKITQCRSQIAKAIPAFYDNHAFHCFGMQQRALTPETESAR